MYQKLLAKLIVKYPGLSKAFLGSMAEGMAKKITEEAQIEGAITELDNLPEGFKVPDMALVFQKEGDRRVQEALKKKKDETPPTNDDDIDDDIDDEPSDKKTKSTKKKSSDPNAALMAKIEALTQSVSELKKEKTQSTLSERLHAKMKEKGIPLTLAKRVTLDKEEDIDTVLADLENDHKEYRQKLLDEGYQQVTVPGGGLASTGGSTTAKAVAEDLKNYAANKQKQEQVGGEKTETNSKK